jgi:membrane-associated protease RseP (regulator of RpoE activity)
MRKTGSVPTYLLGIVILLVGGFVTIAAGGDGEQHAKVRIIESLSDCEADDCEESQGGHRQIIIKCLGDDCDESAISKHLFIGEGGQLAHLNKNGFAWVSADGEDFDFDFHGLQFSKGGFLGVGLTDLSSDLKTHFGVPDDTGVMVSNVVPDSPAAKAGIQVGDIISSVDGEDIKSGGKLARAVRSREAGESVELEIWRDGTLEKLTAGIEERDTSSVHPRAFAFQNKHRGGKNIEIRRLHADEGDFDFDCDGSDDCTVIVKCHDGSCDCTVNGDTADCADIPGVPHHGN